MSSSSLCSQHALLGFPRVLFVVLFLWGGGGGAGERERERVARGFAPHAPKKEREREIGVCMGF